MRALVWKEIRENLVWGLLGLVGMGLALGYILTQMRESHYSYMYQGILGAGPMAVIRFGSLVIGAALGFLHFVPDSLADRWALLVHRPAEPERFLAAKFVSGILLTLAATLAPWLVFCAHAATPGVLPFPVLPVTALPGAACALCGVAAFLGAASATLREGHWLGKRALPVLAAWGCSAAILEAPVFSVAAMVCAFTGALLYLDLRRLMRERTGRPLPSPLASAPGAFVSFLGACQAAAFLAWALALAIPRGDSGWWQLVVDRSGTPVFVESSHNGALKSILDFDGRPVAISQEQRESEAWQLPEGYPDAHEPPYKRPRALVPFWHAQGFNHASETPTTSWFELYREGLLLGINRRTLAHAGYFGPAGWSERPTASTPRFQGGVSMLREPKGLALCAGELYRFHFVDRKVEKLPPLVRGEMRSVIRWYSSAAENSPLVLLASEEWAGLRPDLQPVFRVPAPDVPRTYEFCNAYHDATNGLIHVTAGPRRFPRPARDISLPCFVYTIDTRAGSVSQRQGAPFPGSGSGLPWRYLFKSALEPALFLTWNWARSGVALALGFHDPEFVEQWRPIESLKAAAFGVGDYGERWAGALSKPRLQLLRGGLALAAGCLGAAVAARVLVRRRRWSPACAWVLACLVATGIPGLLAWLATFSWPHLEKCGACGKKQPVDLKECKDCGHPWPAAEPDGTEVFTRNGNTGRPSVEAQAPG